MAGFLALPVLAGAFFYQPTVVDGCSMEPTLRSGQLVWTDRAYYWGHAPQAGEVVVFRHEGATYIKRIYGLPGQTLYWFGDREEYVQPVRAGSAVALRQRWRGLSRPIRDCVPEGHVFVLGDNPSNSVDSRQLGPIPIHELIGRVRMRADVTRLVAMEYSSPPPTPRRSVRTH